MRMPSSVPWLAAKGWERITADNLLMVRGVWTVPEPPPLLLRTAVFLLGPMWSRHACHPCAHGSAVHACVRVRAYAGVR